MRMEAYAERDKFNRLQTSMYGGLSSSIQKGLRDYLSQMTLPCGTTWPACGKSGSCRVTRQEIDPPTKIQDIEGVFRSGYGMWSPLFTARV